MIVRRDSGGGLWLWCPGCEEAHRVSVDGHAAWEWDHDEERPTISPSLLVRGTQSAEGEDFHKPHHPDVAAGGPIVCHSFVRAGRWEFLADSTHLLAGQTVDVVPLPDWLARPTA
ncbi:hypothetical protein QE370_000471 [Aeromicrobium sp. SORGH_AS981]|uniref:DUF6527 family protein n=1 Tax=Aeromicrobium sp. SORGH_AS_0981 TaxID=3041802 RepID=UPI00285B2D63|nr:DUF6527 family protein [Aeromicrobium sp. SORGH_AS_0981]MDR6117287.1 hypothetical protein [Aeromicrobium sp. SORGH_AS_0981]